MMRKLFRNRLLSAVVLLALCCAVCVWRLHAVSNMLPSQQAAERWRGTSTRQFAQVSCFLPAQTTFKRDQLYSFRGEMAKKLEGSSLDPKKEPGLYIDAWCTFDTVKVSSSRQNGDVGCIAVGGNFFDFHPLRLISGSYPRPDDIMDDRVLLDRETAWLLFGGTDLTGMSFSLNGTPFVVAGVYEHESDSFSRSALGDGMSIYMSFDAYERLVSGGPEKKIEEQPIRCYEFVSAEPVRGFARSAAQEKFPVRSAEILENTDRFDPLRLFRLVKTRQERSMHKDNIAYPYWENAARAAEDRALQWLLAAVITGALPLALLFWGAVRSMVFGRRRLEEDVLPGAKDRTKEFFRKRRRRRWEKKHPDEIEPEEMYPEIESPEGGLPEDGASEDSASEDGSSEDCTPEDEPSGDEA